MRLPLALGRAGLEARWTGDGWTWLQAIGKTGYQCPEPWDSQGGTSGNLEEHLSPITLAGVGSGEKKG